MKPTLDFRIKAMAGTDTPERSLAELMDEAWKRFGVTCMWWMIKPDKREDWSIVVNALRDDGGMAAWRLSVEIEKAAKRELQNAA